MTVPNKYPWLNTDPPSWSNTNIKISDVIKRLKGIGLNDRHIVSIERNAENAFSVKTSEWPDLVFWVAGIHRHYAVWVADVRIAQNERQWSRDIETQEDFREWVNQIATSP